MSDASFFFPFLFYSVSPQRIEPTTIFFFFFFFFFQASNTFSFSRLSFSSAHFFDFMGRRAKIRNRGKPLPSQPTPKQEDEELIAKGVNVKHGVKVDPTFAAAGEWTTIASPSSSNGRGLSSHSLNVVENVLGFKTMTAVQKSVIPLLLSHRDVAVEACTGLDGGGEGREGKGREGKGREGKEREGKGREGKERERKKSREKKSREKKRKEKKRKEKKRKEKKRKEKKRKEKKRKEKKRKEKKRKEKKRKEKKRKEKKRKEKKRKEKKRKEKKRKEKKRKEKKRKEKKRKEKKRKRKKEKKRKEKKRN